MCDGCVMDGWVMRTGVWIVDQQQNVGSPELGVRLCSRRDGMCDSDV